MKYFIWLYHVVAFSEMFCLYTPFKLRAISSLCKFYSHVLFFPSKTLFLLLHRRKLKQRLDYALYCPVPGTMHNTEKKNYTPGRDYRYYAIVLRWGQEFASKRRRSQIAFPSWRARTFEIKERENRRRNSDRAGKSRWNCGKSLRWRCSTWPIKKRDKPLISGSSVATFDGLDYRIVRSVGDKKAVFVKRFRPLFGHYRMGASWRRESLLGWVRVRFGKYRSLDGQTASGILTTRPQTCAGVFICRFRWFCMT